MTKPPNHEPPRLRRRHRKEVERTLWTPGVAPLQPHGIAAIVLVFGLIAVSTLAPPATPISAVTLDAADGRQNLTVSASAPTVDEIEVRAAEAAQADSGTALLTSADGVQELANEGTNAAWARMILVMGGWPEKESSVTAIMQWMRQENYENSWWVRNNPLNNGWGVGSFLGTNPNLQVAAANVVDALNTLPGYAGIRETLANGAPASEIAHAIWYSTWAGGHYDYGGHWSTAPVQIIEAPASAWGL